MTYLQKFVAVVTVDGNILREQRDNGIDHVLIPFGSDYTIKLKNLNSVRAVVDVSIDGESVTDGSVVINANSEHDLEGFIRGTTIRNKFRFINKTETIVDNLGDKIDNGFIRISIRYECPEQPEVKHIWHRPSYNPYNDIIGGTPVDKGPMPNSPYIWRDSTSNPLNDGVYGGVLRGMTGDVSCSCSNPQPSLDENDEGITVEGAETCVDYQTTYVSNLEKEEHIIILKLNGDINNKPVTKTKTTREKLQCKTCRLKQSSRHQYCQRCGTYMS